jgi:ATP-dependent RNA helicase DBP3
MKNHPRDSPLPARILVFALYKKEATRLEYTIRNAGYKVAGLHGDLSQDARFKALDAFKEGKVNVLVATDVAARGLDIPDVQLVINVTFPLTTGKSGSIRCVCPRHPEHLSLTLRHFATSAEDFVHRCGRTGRAGKEGKAITFFTGEAHERSLAGEFMRVLRDAGAEIPEGMNRFPSTIKKKGESMARRVLDTFR